MNYAKKLTHAPGTVIYIQILEWLFDLPSFILSKKEKTKAFKLLFDLDQDFNEIKCNYEGERGIFHFTAGTNQYGIIPEEKLKHVQQQIVLNYTQLIVLMKNPENTQTGVSTFKKMSYSKIVDLLNQLHINDRGSEYIVEDYVDALISSVNN